MPLFTHGTFNYCLSENLWMIAAVYQIFLLIYKHRSNILLKSWLVKSNIESYLRQTYDSTSFKPRLINIYLDCYFIDKLFFKMVIDKLIAFLRKDTFSFYFLDIKKPNQIVLWRQTNNTFIPAIHWEKN